MATDLALAVDVGGTRLRAALVRGSGQILHREHRQTPASEGADAVVAAIVSACRAVIAACGVVEPLTVGLCAPGPLDAKRGIAIATPTIRGFSNFPLRAAVANSLGLDVTIENDGPCAALGEWVFGAGRGCQDFVYVTISTGIGGGIVAGGRLLRGRHGQAGHIGHIPVKPVGGATCFCGQPGCWEAEASGSALQRKAQEAGFTSLEDVFARAKLGEATSAAFIDAMVEEFAIGIVAISHVLDPERIVIGGGVSNAFDLYAPKLCERVLSRVLPPFREVQILRSQLGDDAGLLGAAQLALRPDLRG